MLPVVLSLLLFGLISSLDVLTSHYVGREAELRTIEIEQSAAVVMDAMEHFRRIYARFPESMDEMLETEGFESVRRSAELLGGRLHYLHVGYMQSGDGESRDPWSIEVARLGFTFDDPEFDSDEYFSAENNACGDEAAEFSQRWCGMEGSLWTERKGDAELFRAERRVREQLDALGAQMTAFYNAYRQFPRALGYEGRLVTLGSLAGMPDESADCVSGEAYTWTPHVSGLSSDAITPIAITCGSAFVHGGGAIHYSYLGRDRILLVAQTNNKRRFTAAGDPGQPVTVVTEINLGSY